MIQLFKPFIAPEALEQVGRIFDAGHLTQGKEVDLFEEELARFLGNPNIVTVNSCTSAIHLALNIIQEEVQGEIDVISTPMTCAATNLPIVANNMRIVWCDIDLNLNIDLDKVERVFSPFTRVLMVVHWGGIPVNCSKFTDLKSIYYQKYKKELYIIEDCAHAWGSLSHGKHVGTNGNFGAFSCQAIKTLTTGDGGVLITPPQFYKTARLKRWFGLDRDNNISFRSCQDITKLGFKFHMNNVAAAIGRSNLPYLHQLVSKYRINAKYYIEHLHCCVPQVNSYDSPSFWLFTIFLPKRKCRSDFIKFMKVKNIEVGVVHVRNDKFSIFDKFITNLPMMDALEKCMICIPCGWWVDNPKYISDTINDFLRKINDFH